ncbi:DUF4260 domain-containing protein [Haloplasma contractile]|nr:DUF4260 domain-containing protein [Haloplasma contractile]
MNRKLIHIEGLVILILMLVLYNYINYNWWLFIVLLLVPDLSMLGYIINTRIGAVIYNMFHTYVFTVGLAIIAITINHELLLAVSIIFTAHIGMDRTLGYGLKYPSGFKDTHMQRI